MDKLSVALVMTGRIVDHLRADGTIQSLLFQTRPPVSTFDDRIYDHQAELPDGPEREVLPRILVAVLETPWDTEQYTADSSDLYRDIRVITHVLTEARERQLGEAIDARARNLLVSTSLSNATIMASVLVPDGVRQPVRESAFRNAWRFQSEYRAQAGVL